MQSENASIKRQKRGNYGSLFCFLPQTEWFKTSLLTVKEQMQMKGTNTSLLISVLRRNRPNGGINRVVDCKRV